MPEVAQVASFLVQYTTNIKRNHLFSSNGVPRDYEGEPISNGGNYVAGHLHSQTAAAAAQRTTRKRQQSPSEEANPSAAAAEEDGRRRRVVVKIPRNKLDGGEENGVGQKRRRLMKGDDDWNGRISSLGSPEGAHHEDEDAFAMINSDEDEDETTASRDDGSIRYCLSEFSTIFNRFHRL